MCVRHREKGTADYALRLICVRFNSCCENKYPVWPTNNETKVQANKELPPAASTETTEGAAGGKAGSATPQAKTGKSGSGQSPAVASTGGPSWADRIRDLQIDVPAAAAYDKLTSSPGLGARGGSGGAAGIGVEQEQQGEEDQDPASWDGVGVDAATVIHHRRQFDIRCKSYEVRRFLFFVAGWGAGG